MSPDWSALRGVEVQLTLSVEDNTALHLASECAKKLGVPLIWVFAFSPGDYKWHDRSPRRIDFMLRNLQWLKVGHLKRSHRLLCLCSRITHAV